LEDGWGRNSATIAINGFAETWWVIPAAGVKIKSKPGTVAV
jgi:hypothetical protein